MMDEVVLVNEQDVEVGTMEKIEAHEKAILHRAFSVFVFNEHGEMLLQQRAFNKYHCGGLWTNTCCSHPYPGELVENAANRRLVEEMGFSTPLQKAFSFTYKAAFDNGLTEYEYDHVFVGNFSGDIVPNSKEVENYTYKPMLVIEDEIANFPQKYTPWFIIAFPKLKEWLQEHKIYA